MANKIFEDILCLIVGTIIAIAFIATICGDGNLGLLDL